MSADRATNSSSRDLFVVGCGLSSPNLTGDSEPSADTMGAKAYNLLRMADLQLPVPPAFVLGTGYCALGGASAADWLPGLRALEAQTGSKLGDARRPLLLSVRSGAPVSMPGMMETLLNVGLCDVTVPGLLRQTGNPRLVWDAYRRLVATYGEVVAGVAPDLFEAQDHLLFDHRDEHDLDFAELRELTHRYLAVYEAHAGRPFPQDPIEQLNESIAAVFASWQSAKACEYRRLNHLSDEIGTAVTVQAMVFGNAGGLSGAGVGFTRDPASGAPQLWVDFLFNAQGEDVVSGRRSAHGHETLASVMPEAWDALQRATRTLEHALGDMQDFEFTVQDGRLFMLQTRTGKRTPQAAARIALDLLDEGVISPAVARQRTDHLSEADLTLVEVVSDDGRSLSPLASAATACSGVAIGEMALGEERARERHAAGKTVVLVRRDAETSDIAALESAVGLLTERGARTSHAAVVARHLGKVCLVGCAELQLDEAGHGVTIAGEHFQEGDVITLDGNAGVVYRGAVRTVARIPDGLLQRLMALRATATSLQ
ncbi:PEP/pyruvate-binding domain-containing protein [Aquabacterium sp.]|uniref:PEP/pyruvate-binding domain-containing protein n=1 Tax=Aquabacterium sp. TaxID=1872578 RepID=UPI0035B1AF9E